MFLKLPVPFWTVVLAWSWAWVSLWHNLYRVERGGANFWPLGIRVGAQESWQLLRNLASLGANMMCIFQKKCLEKDNTDTILISIKQFSSFRTTNCIKPYNIHGASLVAQTVKNLHAMQETRVQSLGRKDPLEEEMATHSSIFAWRILVWVAIPFSKESSRPKDQTQISCTTGRFFTVWATRGAYSPVLKNVIKFLLTIIQTFLCFLDYKASWNNYFPY